MNIKLLAAILSLLRFLRIMFDFSHQECSFLYQKYSYNPLHFLSKIVWVVNPGVLPSTWKLQKGYIPFEDCSREVLPFEDFTGTVPWGFQKGSPYEDFRRALPLEDCRVVLALECGLIAWLTGSPQNRSCTQCCRRNSTIFHAAPGTVQKNEYVQHSSHLKFV